MPISATFQADFSSFQDAVAKAQVQLASFESGAGKVQTSLDKMGNALSGTKMIQQATLMGEAVEQLGGVSTLTAAQLQKLGAQANEAIEKMGATGITDIPPSLQAVATAANQAQSAFTSLGESWVARIAEGQLLRDAIRNVVGAFTSVIEGAVDNTLAFGDLARATGLSTTAVQQFSLVGDEFGLKTGQMAEAAGDLGAKLASGNASAVFAVDSLGLSVKQLIAEGPEQAFLDVVTAANRISDPMQRSATFTELFGQQLGRLIAQIPDLQGEIAQLPPGLIVGPETISEIQQVKSAWDQFVADAEAAAAKGLVGVIHVANALTPPTNTETEEDLATGHVLPPEDRTPPAPTPTPVALQYGPQIDALTQVQNVLRALQQHYDALTPAQVQYIALAKQAGESTNEIAASLSVEDGVIQRVIEAQTQAAEAAKKAQAATEAFQGSVKNLTTDAVGAVAGFGMFGALMPDLNENMGDFTGRTTAFNNELQGLTDDGLLPSDDELQKFNKHLLDLKDVGQNASGVMDEFYKETSKVPDTLGELAKTLGTVTSALDELARASSGTFSEMVRDAAQVTQSLATTARSAKEFAAAIAPNSNASTGDKIGAGVALGSSFISSVATGTNFGNTGADVLGGGLSGAASGAEIGSVVPGIGTAIGAAIGGITGAITGVIRGLTGGPSQSELQTRSDLSSFLQPFETQSGNQASAIQPIENELVAIGKTAPQAQAELAALLDAKTPEAYAAALAPITADLATFTAQASAAQTAVNDVAGNFNAIAAAAGDNASALTGLAGEAEAAFAAEVASGKSAQQALADIQPGLASLQKDYADLGMTITDAGLQALVFQSNLAQAAPDLINGIAGLASEFKDLDSLGLMNTAQFAQMEQQGEAMYTGIQAQVASLGGSTRDALLPMQQYLHNAADEATALGVPLDANTQAMIDQSKALGIWNDNATTDPTAALTTSIEDLTTAINTMLTSLGLIPAAVAAIPSAVNVAVNYTGPDGSSLSAPTTQEDANNPSGATTGGIVGMAGVYPFSGGGVVPMTAGAVWPMYLARGWTPHGTDTVPAMLTPGEWVLNAAQQKALMSGGGETYVVNLGVNGYMDSPASQAKLGRTVRNEMSRLVRSRRKLSGR